jgi:hypothetical protein
VVIDSSIILTLEPGHFCKRGRNLPLVKVCMILYRWSNTYHFCEYAVSNYRKKLTLGYEETHIWSYKPAPLFNYYQLGFASGGDSVKLIKIRFFFHLNRLKLIQKTDI